MKFTKMQGIGNDYIFFNCFAETVENPSALAVKLSRRRFSVGGDGIVLILPSEVADCRMEIYNADGSRAMMCGNASRCVGKFVYERGLVHKKVVTMETPSGIKTLYLEIENEIVVRVRVDMGEPGLTPESIPTTLPKTRDVPLSVGEQEYRVTCVSMGNPHCVVFTGEPETLELEKTGPLFEHHPAFPERINTEFVRVISRKRLQMRVWERGSGETLACGTGACASAVAAVENGLCGRQVEVVLRGGTLLIEWDEKTNHVFMTGPAEIVYDGEL